MLKILLDIEGYQDTLKCLSDFLSIFCKGLYGADVTGFSAINRSVGEWKHVAAYYTAFIKVTSNLDKLSTKQTTVVLENRITPIHLCISYTLTEVTVLSVPRRRRKESEAFSVVYCYWDRTYNCEKEAWL